MSDLKLIQDRINFYQNQLNLLYDNKPFWFQKNALKRYNEKIEFFEDKIMNIYLSFEKEIDFDIKILEQIKNNTGS